MMLTGLAKTYITASIKLVNDFCVGDKDEMVQPGHQRGRRPQEQREEWFGKMPEQLPSQPEC